MHHNVARLVYTPVNALSGDGTRVVAVVAAQPPGEAVEAGFSIPTLGGDPALRATYERFTPTGAQAGRVRGVRCLTDDPSREQVGAYVYVGPHAALPAALQADVRAFLEGAAPSLAGGVVGEGCPDEFVEDVEGAAAAAEVESDVDDSEDDDVDDEVGSDGELVDGSSEGDGDDDDGDDGSDDDDGDGDDGSEGGSGLDGDAAGSSQHGSGASAGDGASEAAHLPAAAGARRDGPTLQPTKAEQWSSTSLQLKLTDCQQLGRMASDGRLGDALLAATAAVKALPLYRDALRRVLWAGGAARSLAAASPAAAAEAAARLPADEEALATVWESHGRPAFAGRLRAHGVPALALLHAGARPLLPPVYSNDGSITLLVATCAAGPLTSACCKPNHDEAHSAGVSTHSTRWWPRRAAPVCTSFRWTPASFAGCAPASARTPTARVRASA